MQMEQERRRSPRVEASYPVAFPGGEGLTRNVSRTGLLFESPKHFAAGTRIRISVEVARGLGGTIVIQAHVVRSISEGEGWLIAVHIERMSFEQVSGRGNA